jgi:hypothetical protein
MPDPNVFNFSYKVVNPSRSLAPKRKIYVVKGRMLENIFGYYCYYLAKFVDTEKLLASMANILA